MMLPRLKCIFLGTISKRALKIAIDHWHLPWRPPGG